MKQKQNNPEKNFRPTWSETARAARAAKKQKVVAALLLFLMIAEVVRVPVTVAATLYNFGSLFENTSAQSTPQKEEFGLVAVLVEESLLDNSTNYDGLKPKYPGSLDANTLKDRIQRYALDVQHSQEFTKSVIVSVKKNQPVTEIMDSLEKLYLEGDDSENKSRLIGVVLVGDVPLPVVNKNGHRFMSLLPYTDFVDKTYVFESESNDFIPNAGVTSHKAEVWHGVIHPPAEGEEGNKLLALYFDKNHLFHCKSNECSQAAKDFQEFEKKFFYADLVHEFQQLNKAGFGNYLRYLSIWEDLSYDRFSKKLLQQLLQEQDLSGGNKIDDDKDGKIDEDPINGLDDDFDGEKGSPLHGIADGIDNDNDGEIDEPDEGRFGLCDLLPNVPAKIKDCSIPGKPLMEGNFYNVKPGSRYFAYDNIDNDGNGLVDEGIDEDDGDPFKGIDNDKDGLVDEDTLQDNDLDGDGKVDEDPPGDANGDGCPGECGQDEDLDSYDFDSDGYPNGYEKEIGSKPAVDVGNNIASEAANSSAAIPTDPENPLWFPLDLSTYSPRLMPLPLSDNWIDEGSKNDDDEDGKVDEDGTADNDNDKDGLTDEDSDGTNPPGFSVDEFPDLQTKDLVNQLASKYFDLFDKFKANVNDWTNFTGRYQSRYKDELGQEKSDVSTIPGLITAKDEFTRNYLRIVNDLIENKIDSFIENKDPSTPQLQSPIPLIQGAKMIPTITLSDDTAMVGNEIDFINMVEHDYFDTKVIPPIPATDVFLNGVPSKYLTSVKDCSLFRGSKGPEGSNSVMVEAHHLNNVFDASENPDFGGCIAKNKFHPEQCVEEFAKLPLFDLLGAREVNSGSESDTSYRACFDLKEKQRLTQYFAEVVTYLALIAPLQSEEQKAVIPKPGSPYQTPDTIILGISLDPSKPFLVTLAQLLPIWGGFDQKDNNGNGTVDELEERSQQYGINPADNRELSERIFQQTALYTFESSPLLFPPFVKAISLQVLPLPVTDVNGNIRMISSFNTNKEPTAETLLAQSDMGKAPLSMPIDNPRYFTFKDKNGLFRKVKYPNLFAAKSLRELQLILEAKENELQKIADETGTQLSFKGVLTDLLKDADLYHDVEKKDYLVQADTQKLADAYAWKQSSIDQKHAYVLKTYLNPSAEGYTAEAEKGFEAVYLNAEAQDQNILLHFNADVPLSEDDAAFNNAQKQQKPEPTQPGGASENTGTSSQALQDYDPSAEQGVDFFLWFGEMQKWVEKTMQDADLTNVSPSCGISDAPGDYYEQLLAMGDADADGVPDATDENPNSGDSDSDGIPDGAEKTKSFRLTADKQVLKAGSADTLKITIEAFSAQNQLQKSDNFSTVNLVVKYPQGKELANISSVHPVTLTNGKAVITLMATDESGAFFVSANSPGRSDIVSNTLSLSSTRRQVRVTSYRSGDAATYKPVSANGFIVKDENDTVIAEVDGATGMVTITDDRFELVALPAKGPDAIRPTRLTVQEKTSHKVYASVFFVADEKLPLTIDGASMNSQNSFQNLKGVHVKDVVTEDGFSIDENSNKGDTPKLYLVVKATDGLLEKRVGMIDAKGNIFLNDSLRLDFAKTQKKNDPVVFEIKNTEGVALFEVYIGASFPKIQILKEEGLWANFNTIAQISARLFSVAVPTPPNSKFFEFVPTAMAAELPSENLSVSTTQQITQSPKNIFSDVSPHETGYKEIMMLYERGVVSGYSDGTFKPDQLLSREEFVKLDLGSICVRCTEFISSVKTAIDLVYNQHPFPDQNITPNLQYCVKEGRNRQIVSGYGSGEQKGYFLPKNPISRAEAFKVILETSRAQLGNFSVEVPDGKPWYYPYILETQKQKLFPATSVFFALNTVKPEDFKTWFDKEIANSASQFTSWLQGSVNRREFAMIVARFVSMHDCLKDDADQDGLPDNYEKYLYGTSPQNADTDKGGVKDGDEVARKTNPLDAADDQEKDDHDGMPADFETKYGLNPNDPSDALKDLDGDGLSNLEEFQYGTDPTKPDTDNGGVWDGDEILEGIDPLKGEDDLKFLMSDQGGYIVSNTAYENLVYAQEGAENKEAGRILEYVSEVPSDGSSKLFVKASILGEDGLIDRNDSSSVVQFTAMENSGEYATILQKTVQVVKGEAETEIQATTKAGSLLISAVVQSTNVPTDIHTIDVVPQKPISIELTEDSPIIRSGGFASTMIHAQLLDVNKNIANNGVYQLTFKVEGAGRLDESVDEMADKEGVQISSITGSFDLRLFSTENPGDITVTASYEPPVYEENAVIIGPQLSAAQAGVSAQTVVKARQDIKLQVTAEKSQIPSDYQTVTKLQLKVVDGNGLVVSEMRGQASFKVADPRLGKIIGDTEAVVTNGQAVSTFQASNIAGDALVTATIDGFEPATAIVTTLPKAPAWIEIESDQDTLDISTEIELRAKLYDRDGNFAFNDSTSTVNFALTESTKKFGTFKGDTKVKAENGVAAITLQSTQFTGPINIIASGENLLDGTLALKSVQKLKASDFKNLTPNSLFATILGSDFGDITNDESLANWFLFSENRGISGQNTTQQVAKTQVISTLTSKPKPFLHLVEIASNGAVKVLDEERFAVRVLPKTEIHPYQRLVLSDLLAKKDVAEISMVLKPQNKTVVLAAGDSLKQKPEGVYVQKITEAENYELKPTEQGVSILRDQTALADIGNNGSVTLFDSDITVALSEEQKNGFLTLRLEEAGTVIAEISYVNAFETDVEQPEDGATELNTGVHVRLLQKFPHLRFESTFSGNSSALPKGLALVDTQELAPELQRPGLNYLSLEKADETNGLGFTGDNKQMLLFASGNSVGESTVPYASEIGIVLGDPTIRVSTKNTISSGTGFTQDIGKEIFTGDEPVQELVTLDYNGDGLEDVLVGYKSGKVRLLQNHRGVQRFEDKGIFLDFPTGVVSITGADFDKDGFDDLVVATQDSCKKGEVCIDLYHNNKGNFERSNLALKPFTQNNRVYKLEAVDLNNDGYPDLVTSDDTGTIRAFYNQKGRIGTDGKFVGTLGLHIDSTANLKSEVAVWYNDSKANEPSPDDDQQFVVLPLEDVVRDFIYLDLDNSLGLQSEKKALDITGSADALARGDEVEYTITLKNTSQKTLQNVWVNDVVSDSLEFKKDSLKCLDCKGVTVETGISLRPFAIGGFDIPAGKTRTITYRATVKDGIKVRMSIGHNLTDGYPVDNYFDISASPENNPTGREVYFYSSGKDPVSGQITYKSYTTPPPAPPEPPQLPQEMGGIDPALLNIDINQDGVPDQIQAWVDEYTAKNKDKITSQVEEAGKTLDKIGDSIEAGIAAFSCKGGCIPMPVNFAFLAPGAINMMGVPGGFDPGLPVFAAGIPSLIPVWPPSPYQGSVVRTYLSPTLTGSLGMGICMGPYLGGQCFAFKVADLIPADICEQIVGEIQQAIAGANAVAHSSNGTSIFNSDGNVPQADNSSRFESGGVSGSTNLGSYSYKASLNTNFRIPGFPAVITNWLDRQTEEIVNKITDLPDIYFIYPDPTSIAGMVVPQDTAQQTGASPEKPAHQFPKVKKWTNFRQVLNYLNSIPLVQIQAQEVLIKIPALTDEELVKLQRDAQQWLADTKAEFERFKQIWSCDQNSPYKTICDSVTLQMGDLINGVEKNLETLEKYKELPRKILAWRNFTAKYAYQIICYLDAIIKYTGGYLHKQQTRIEGWIEMIRKIKQTLADWKLLVDLTVEYQASCDKCTTARFTLMELILKLFAILPEPPVIPFPKLPDIAIDLSQIQTGLKILWPDVRFRPEPIIMPKLPRIQLPGVPSLNISVELPPIPLLPEPPDLPELPDLPPLPLPTLPDIPPPPKIPSFPASIRGTIALLQKIIRILCLIKKGLIPISEILLKSHIEQLTERPLSPMLPVDLGVKLQFPPIKYDYVDRISFLGKLNFQMDFSQVYEFVQLLADKANGITTNLVEALNNNTAELSNKAQQGADIINNAAEQANPLGTEEQQLDIDLSSSIQSLLAQGTDTNEDSFALLSNIYPALGSTALEFSQAVKTLEQDAKKYQQLNEKVEDFHLIATQRLLSSDDPLLNRSLADVKAGIAAEAVLENSSDQRMVALRDALIAYADDQNSLDVSLQSNENLAEMGRLLAQVEPLQDRLPTINEDVSEVQQTLTASLEPFSPQKNENSPANQTIQKAAFIDYATSTQKDIKNSLQLLADIALPDVPENSGMPDPIAVNKGLFIYNQAAQVNERLINYTDEADLPSRLAFIDFDNDIDNDVLYSYGGNIYLKENFKFNPVRTYVGDAPAFQKLEDIEPAYGAVQNFVANYAGNKSIDVSWDRIAIGNIGGYEMVAAKTLGAFDTKNAPTFKVAMIADTSTNHPSPITAESVEGEVFVESADGNKSSQQKLQKNDTLLYDTTLSTKTGNAVLRLRNGSYVTIEPNESVLIKKLDNAQQPSLKLELPNGFYYARMAVFDTVGRRGTRTPATLLAPSLCGDKQIPFPNAGDSNRRVAILKTLTINASKSFDPGSEIAAYWLDANLKEDTQPDGDPTNDKDIVGDLDASIDSNGDGNKTNDLDNPVFRLGPFQDLKDRTYKLNIVDEAGNGAGQEINVQVYVPGIALDDVTATAGLIQGKLDPAESDMPISIFRVRDGIRTKITTPSADVNGKYFSDENGEFTIEDLNLNDSLVILNSKGEIVAEINAQTGQIVLVRQEYSLEVLPAEKPLLPTRIVVKDPNGTIITTLFLVADLNTDATIDDPGVEYNRVTVDSFKGVHVKDIDPLDDISMQKIAADDPVNPGAVEMLEGSSKKRVAILDTGGNFYVLDERIGLKLREGATLQDPLVIQIILKEGDSPKLLGEFYVGLTKHNPLQILSSKLFTLFQEGAVSKGPLFDTDKDGMPDQWELAYGLNPDDANDALKDNDGDGLNNKAEYRANTNPNNSDSDGDGYNDKDELVYGKNANEKATSPFADVSVNDPHYQSILDLSQRNVLKGREVNGSLLFDPSGNITRKEFADIMLKIFCIAPRKQAYEAPAPFSDVPYDPENYYYPIIKEAYFQGFITGYLGELNPETGKAPFKPDNTISRAEASKIIEEALEREGVIDLSKVPVTEPWYNAYMQVSQNLGPYLKEKSAAKNIFINTAEESKNPTKVLTRGEFVTVADRVLTAYDCTKIDDDGDGIPGYWETQHGLNPTDPGDANKDPDGDGLINLDEFTYGTDPFDADTDKGGVKDGVEIEKGTNAANNPGDDPQDTDGDGLTDQAEKNVFGTDPFNPDTDGGGVNDGDEVLLYNTNPLEAKDDKDSDKDGLSDNEETTIYKTDPFNPDTDGGGIQDGVEVQRGTDPLNKTDDIVDPRSSLEEGIYLIQEPCVQCPCQSSLAHTADLLPGDTVLAVISKNDESQIFSKSNEVRIESVPK